MYRPDAILRRSLPVSVLVFVLFASLVSVSGTTVVTLNSDDLVLRAELVVHGSCIDRFSFREGDGLVFTRYTFRVHETLQGDDLVEAVFVMPGGEANGIATLIPGLSEYQRGDELVLFLSTAYGAESERRLPVGLDQGVYRVSADPESGAAIISRSLNGLTLAPPPADAERSSEQFPEKIGVAQFKECVRAKVAACASLKEKKRR